MLSITEPNLFFQNQFQRHCLGIEYWMLWFFDIAEPDDVNVVRVRVTEDYTI